MLNFTPKIFLIFSFLLLPLCVILSQKRISFPDSTFEEIQKDKQLIELNILLKSLNLSEIDTIKYVLDYYDTFLDSAKNLYELEIVLKEDLIIIEGLSMAEELIEHQQRRELLLRTVREYYKNQPNYNLGVVGQYLEISNRVATIVLAILTL